MSIADGTALVVKKMRHITPETTAVGGNEGVESPRKSSALVGSKLPCVMVRLKLRGAASSLEDSCRHDADAREPEEGECRVCDLFRV